MHNTYWGAKMRLLHPFPFLLAIASTGCATQTPPMARVGAEAPPPSTGWDNAAIPDDLKNALNAVDAKRVEYKAEYDKKVVIQTSFDSGLLALAAAGISAAFYGAGRDLVGGFGLGSGVLSAYRGYYDPSNEAAAYLKGFQNLRCIDAAAQMMLTANPKHLLDMRDKLYTSLQNSTVQESSPSSVQSAGNSALQAVDEQLAAYNQAPFTVRAALDTIEDRVELANHRNSPAAADIQNTLNASLASASQGAASAAAARAKWAQAVQDTADQQAAANVASDQGSRDAPAAQGAAAASAQVTTNSNNALEAIPIPPYTDIMAHVTACSAG